MALHLQTTQGLIKQYQEVLTSDWSSNTLQTVLRLADEFLDACDVPLGFSHAVMINAIPPHFIVSLQNFIAQINEERIPALPKQWPQRRTLSKRQHSQLALEIVYNLTFPLFTEKTSGESSPLRGNVRFFRDIQSLLFLITSQHVLPMLQKERMKEELHFLIPVLFYHCLTAWHDNLAHQNYLLSVLFENLGIHDLVLHHLYITFQLTPPDDHDYLTKAQAYWSALIDAEMYREADDFVLRLLRQCPEKHVDEVKEIAQLNFELQDKHAA